MNRCQRGFTLVELLVIITIIGILVALIIPGVNSVREGSRQTQCLNNEMNIGKAILTYEVTGKHLPGILNTLQSPKGVTIQYNWVEAILPNLERSDLWDLVLTGGISPNMPVAEQITVLRCPNDPYLSSPKTSNFQQGVLSYAVNDGFFVDLRTNPPKDIMTPPHTVAAPSSSKLTSRPNISQTAYARGANVSSSTTIMLGELTGDGTPTNPHVAGPWTTLSITATSPPLIPPASTPLTFHWPVQYGTTQQPSPPLPVPVPVSPNLMVSSHPGKVIVVYFDGHGEGLSTDATFPQ
jgi:prepilin-type N-terminal cleavage/methylation domain-containing protein/prepilin-type processing-associated H-X9-DG protein